MFILGVLLLLITFSACSSDDQDGLPDISEETEISQELAWQIVKTLVLKNELSKIDVWVSKNAIQPNTTIEVFYPTELSPDYTSWLFFIDDSPFENWGHSCRYVYVNVVGGKYIIHEKQSDPPMPLAKDFTPLIKMPIEEWDKWSDSV